MQRFSSLVHLDLFCVPRYFHTIQWIWPETWVRVPCIGRHITHSKGSSNCLEQACLVFGEFQYISLKVKNVSMYCRSAGDIQFTLELHPLLTPGFYQWCSDPILVFCLYFFRFLFYCSIILSVSLFITQPLRFVTF